jgi:hypothetical protein
VEILLLKAILLKSPWLRDYEIGLEPLRSWEFAGSLSADAGFWFHEEVQVNVRSLVQDLHPSAILSQLLAMRACTLMLPLCHS